MHTIRATLPDISVHLEVAILRAEMHISSQHHLHIGLLLREHHGNVTVSLMPFTGGSYGRSDTPGQKRGSTTIQMQNAKMSNLPSSCKLYAKS
jgi:hypothetical protein